NNISDFVIAFTSVVESTTEAQTTPQSTTSASVTTKTSTTISQSTTQKSATSLKTDVPSTDPRSTTTASSTDLQSTTSVYSTDPRSTTPASSTDLQSTTSVYSTDPRSTAHAPSTDVQSTTSAHSTDVQSTAQSPNAPATDTVSTNEQTTADLSHSTEQPTTAPQWTDTWADLPTSSFHPMTSSLTPSTTAENSRCFVGHIEFDCLPESTTVEDIKNRTSEEQLPLHDLLALMTWIADHDVIPAGVANVTDYADTYVDNVDNLLDDRFVETWDTAQAVPDFATNLVQSSQNLLEDLARKAPSEYQHVRKANNLEYEVLKSTNISEYSFKSRSSDDESSSTSITLEKQTIDNLMLQGNDNLSFTTLLTRKGNLIHERLSRRQPASHVIVHSLQVSGQIVSVPVTLQLKLLQERKPNEEPVCAFLDESKRSGEWSTVGCYVDKNKDTSSSISCKCNHTTSFAVLMQLQDFEISEADEKALEVLTYLLCGLSIMGLMTTLSVFMALRSLLKSERVTIHMNLSVALIVAHFLLLVSGMAAKQQVVCRIVAILMHYFFLAVFCWMLVEGAHLYFQIVRVFSNGMDKKKTYMVIGWGTPSVVVIISAASRWDDYVNYDSCWLSMESNVIWAFVGPALAIIMVNVIVLVMVVRIIVTSAAANKDKEYDHVKAGLKGSLFLLPILGLTWVFGVLSMDPNTLVFQYLFVIFNALQGVFIFLIYCAFNSEVRSAIQRSREKRALTRGDAISKASTAENYGYPLKGGWGKRNRVDVSTTCSSGEPQGQQMATLKIQTKTTTHITTHMILTPASDGSYLTPTNVKFAAWKLDEER
ncbi:adhesion G-protein coupled receptor D1-like, partial [Patiria miniata]|uniref:Uncharacterized protein n=1 Tax=Patiria miniata TaxID=46514 RepID=A0A914A8P1_PATMI